MSVAVRPFLMFEGKAEEAMQTYVSLVPGSKIIELQKCGPGSPGKEGTVMRGVFSVADGGAVHRQLRAPCLHLRRPSRSSWTASQAHSRCCGRRCPKAAAR